MLDVIDVSRWQGTIDWKKVKASGKVGGVMIRAVSTKSGQLYVDPCFEANYAGAKSVGLPVGVYAYTVAVTEGMAKKELNLLKTCLEGKRFELPIAMDVEDSRLKSLPAAELTFQVAIRIASRLAAVVRPAVQPATSWSVRASRYRMPARASIMVRIRAVTEKNPPSWTKSPNARAVNSSTRNLLPAMTSTKDNALTTRPTGVGAARIRATTRFFTTKTSSRTTFSRIAVSSASRKVSEITRGNSSENTPSTTR